MARDPDDYFIPRSGRGGGGGDGDDRGAPVQRLRAWLSKLGVRALWVIWLFIAFAVMSTMVDRVKPGQVGVIMNNLTGSATVKASDGIVVHMPLGITRVYSLDKTQQVSRMTARKGVGDRSGVDNLQLKTSDGTNIFVDLEVAYNINPAMARENIQIFGAEDAYKLGMVRSMARSRVRDKLGELSLQDIVRAENRRLKVEEARAALNDALSTLGIVVSSVSVTDLDYSEQYKTMITERLKVEQEIRNQEAAKRTAESEKLAVQAGAERLKSTMLAQVGGEQAKRVIDAQGESGKILQEADAQAYRDRKEGDQQLEVAINEAQALEQEGLKKAEGIRRMADAFRTGGLSLVREALAKKYTGKQIKGKPYTLENRVERLQIETPKAGAAATIAPKGGTSR